MSQWKSFWITKENTSLLQHYCLEITKQTETPLTEKAAGAYNMIANKGKKKKEKKKRKRLYVQLYSEINTTGFNGITVCGKSDLGPARE